MEAAAPAAGRARARASAAAGRFWETLLWGLAAAAAAMLLGAGVVWNEQVTLDAVIVLAAGLAIARWPILAVVALALLLPRNSPFAQMAILAGGAVALVIARWRPAALPFVISLALFLLVALPQVRFEELPPFAAAGSFVVPVAGFEFMDRPAAPGLQWLLLALSLVAALLAGAAIRTRRMLELFVFVVLAAALQPLYAGIDQLISGDLVARGGFDAVRGPYGFPNEYAFHLLVVATLGLVAAFEARDPRARGASAVVAAVATVMLMNTYTRSAWIAFAGVLLILAVFRYRRLVVLGVVALALAITGAPSAAESVGERFSDLTGSQPNQKNSWSWRRGQWDRMLHFGHEKPFLGQGFGSYRRLTLEEFGYQDNTFSTLTQPVPGGALQVGFPAHNDYVKSYVETGVVGLALWVIVLFAPIAVAVRAARLPELVPWALALGALTFAFALISIADNVQTYVTSFTYLALLTGAVAGVANARRSSSASRPMS